MDGRIIVDLKVADLRRELEKRSLDKTGVKQVLLDRLKEALEADGHDPLNFRFSSEENIGNDFSVSNLGTTTHELTAKSRESLQEAVNENFDGIEQFSQKKVADETVPYVVQVGEQEEDLDYDLKSENNNEVIQSIDHVEIQNSSNEPSNLLETNTDQLSKTVSQPSNGTLISLNNMGLDGFRNLWISNLPNTVKAAELKQHFSKVGKVISATVVVSTRKPGGCFGFLQMISSEDAMKAASTFDSTEFRGSVLHVEVTDRKAPTQSSKSIVSRPKYIPRYSNYHVAQRNYEYRKRLAAIKHIQLRRIAVKNAIARSEAKKRLESRLHRSERSINTDLPESVRSIKTSRYDSYRNASHIHYRPLRPYIHKSFKWDGKFQKSYTSNSYGSLKRPRIRISDYSERYVPSSNFRTSIRPSSSPNRSYVPRSNEQRIYTSSSYSSRGVLHKFSRSSFSNNYRPRFVDNRYTTKFDARDEGSRSVRERVRPAYDERRVPFKHKFDSPNFNSNGSRAHYRSPSHSSMNTDKPFSVSRPLFRSPNYHGNGQFERSVTSQSSSIHSKDPNSRPRFYEMRQSNRAVSRSPPRSRDSAMMRPYPGVPPEVNRHRINSNIRNRSPTDFGHSSRSEIVDYKHSSNFQSNWFNERKSKMSNYQPTSMQSPYSHRPMNSSSSNGYGNRMFGRRS